MKLFIPISCNGGGEGKTGWALSLATSFIGRTVQMQIMSGSHADRACNNMANTFLRSECEIMLVIDIDTEFSKRDVDRAVAHIERGAKAVWGLYPKKEDTCPPCVNTWPEVLPPDENGLVNVRRAGRGFLAITRAAFEGLKEENGGPARKFLNHGEPEWAFFHSGVVEGEYSAIVGGGPEWISEDWMLCEDLRKYLGIPTLVDTNIALAHIGPKTYRFPAERLIRTDHNITSWRDIHGWFDYEEFYRFVVNDIPDGGKFCEVGCWLGKSIAAFASFSKEAGKDILLAAVDTFEGIPDSNEQALILEHYGGNVEKACRGNLEALGVGVMIATMKSAEAASALATQWDAVFIDAAHDYESVRADILAWLPKVKRGGILGGHDYDERGVAQAVEDAWREGSFGNNQIQTMGRCWYVRV